MLPPTPPYPALKVASPPAEAPSSALPAETDTAPPAPAALAPTPTLTLPACKPASLEPTLTAPVFAETAAPDPISTSPEAPPLLSPDFTLTEPVAEVGAAPTQLPVSADVTDTSPLEAAVFAFILNLLCWACKAEIKSRTNPCLST